MPDMDTRVQMVDRLRLWILVLLRVAALVWIFFAFGRFAESFYGVRAAFYGPDDEAGWITNFFIGHDGIYRAFWMMGNLAAIAALTVFSRKLACWIVPAARACPACGYNIGATKCARCPECGEWVAPSHGAGTSGAPSSAGKPQ